MKEPPDVFTHVHQGIRRALFDASTALARAQGEPEALASALELVDDALLFVHRHGENEDALLVPLLDARAPQVAARMHDAHQRIESELETVLALRARVAPELYLRLSVFIAHYLEHMAEEELDLEPEIRAVISDEELVSIDYTGNPHSAVVDALSTAVMEKRMVKVVAWYDNEWGYSNKCLEMVRVVAGK